uniref:Uncharacterized protein n=1 Tax=Arundo donax TaxID=35708 RepID=A0A0A9B947_ARUDO
MIKRNQQLNVRKRSEIRNISNT